MHYRRILAKIAIHNALEIQNNGWTPDWNDDDQLKFTFGYDHSSNTVEEYIHMVQEKPTEEYGHHKAILYVLEHHADDIELYFGVNQ